ncbi:MAG: rhomboid family intramembrane serine protease [Rhodothermales bacterium]
MNRLQSWYRAQPRAFRALLTINVVIYVLWAFLFAYIDVTRDFVFNHLALDSALPGVLFEPWQLITYNFLHLGSFEQPGLSFGSLLHIGFNMLWLYWIGRDHEDLHGPYQLTALYLITGVGGGLFSVMMYALMPGLLGAAPVIHGASASVIGVSMAVAVMYPHKKIGLFLIGAVRLLYLVLAFLVIDVLFRFGGGVAVTAHLGGALFGFLFVMIEKRGVDLSSWARLFFRERRPRHASSTVQGGSFLERLEARLASRSKDQETSKEPGRRKRKSKSPMAKIRTLHAAEKEERPFQDEVDRILEKISEQGFDSLTEEEKRVLYEASRR